MHGWKLMLDVHVGAKGTLLRFHPDAAEGGGDYGHKQINKPEIKDNDPQNVE